LAAVFFVVFFLAVFLLAVFFFAGIRLISLTLNHASGLPAIETPSAHARIRYGHRGGGWGARTLSTPKPPRGFYFFLAAFFLVVFFLAVFLRAFFLAGIEEIPPFSP
jgi:hypothetical protein